jgi:hypothetical protein
MEAGLEGVTGGSLLEGTEELPVRVRLGAGLRGDPVAIGDMPILPPGAAQVAARASFPPCRCPPWARCGWSRRKARSPGAMASG